MKILVLVLFFLFIRLSSYSQGQVMEDYDFSKGEYYIIGLTYVSDSNTLQDSLGNFYIDDIALLNELKKTWTFNTKTPRYEGGYHYTLHICKNGKSIEYFQINLNCNIIITDKGTGSFYFDSNKLRKLYGKVKVTRVEYMEKPKVIDLDAYISRLLENPAIIMVRKPIWCQYEGKFTFIYKCPELKEKEFCLKWEDQLLKRIEKEIISTYPGEKFVLTGAGGSKSEIFITVAGNKSLFEKFSLYPLKWSEKRPKQEDWEYYKKQLTIVWK